MTIVYCPTEEMIADFFTKPLQGALFRKFKALILGHVPIAPLGPAPASPSLQTQSQSPSLLPAEERVEDNEPSDRSSQDRKNKRSEDKIEGRPTRVTFADVVKGKVNVRSGAADVNETP